MNTEVMSASATRKNFADILNHLSYAECTFYVCRQGRIVGKVTSVSAEERNALAGQVPRRKGRHHHDG